jgi:hypothetical protein
VPLNNKNLVKQGKVVEGSTVNLARVGLGLAVKQGAPKPDISTVEAFKRTLLNAKAIAYSTAGLSGLQFISTAEKLGVGEQVKAKSKTIPAGAAAELVAKGEADLRSNSFLNWHRCRECSRRPISARAANLHCPDWRCGHQCQRQNSRTSAYQVPDYASRDFGHQS